MSLPNADGVELGPVDLPRYDLPAEQPSVPADTYQGRGLIADPQRFARDAGAASWLFLCGEEFAAMEGGIPRPVRRH